MCNITINRIVLVKDKTTRYNFDRTVTTPEKAAEVFKAIYHLDTEIQEVLCALYLNNQKQIVGIHEISRGTINKSLCSPAELFKAALLHNANAVIVAHNHPAGDPKPSREDIASTQRLADAGRLLDVELLDHVIIGDDSITSLAEEGYI